MLIETCKARANTKAACDLGIQEPWSRISEHGSTVALCCSPPESCRILFLDVFFPAEVKRILFIDADQIVRANAKLSENQSSLLKQLHA